MAKKKSKTQKPKVKKPKIQKAKTAGKTWKAKKKPTGKKVAKKEIQYESEFRLQDEDGKYYSDLACTQSASSPEDFVHLGWEREDEPVDNPAYPKVKVKITLKRRKSDGDEPVVGFMG